MAKFIKFPTQADWVIEGCMVILIAWYTVNTVVVALQLVVLSVKINVVFPEAIPVTNPLPSMLAIAGLLLIHVPPVVGDNCTVFPIQIEPGDKTTGKGFTVTAVVVLLQLEEESVKVNVTFPAAIPLTIPALVTAAIDELLLTQAPPVTGDN